MKILPHLSPVSFPLDPAPSPLVRRPCLPRLLAAAAALDVGFKKQNKYARPAQRWDRDAGPAQEKYP